MTLLILAVFQSFESLWLTCGALELEVRMFDIQFLKDKTKKDNVSSNFTFCYKMLLCIAVLYEEKSVNERLIVCLR